MEFFEWGVIRKNLLFPFFVLIFYLVRTLIKIKMEDIRKDLDNPSHPFLYTFYMFLGEFIGSFIMFIYEKIKPKKDSSEESKNSQQQIKVYLFDLNFVTSESDNNEYKITKKTIFIIFITCLLDTISYSISITIGFFQLSIVNKKLDNEWLIENKLKIFQLIFSAFLCHKMLKIQLHRHHYFSIYSIIIFMLFLIIWDYFEILYNEFKIYISIILILIFNTFLYAFQEVLEKYLMDIYFLSINKLLYYQGIIGMLFTFFILIILINMKCFYYLSVLKICKINEKIESFSSILNLMKNMDYLLISIIYILLCSGVNIYKLQTNKMMTPMHRTIADSAIMPIYVLIYYPNTKLNVLIITLIISIFVLFICLVYCEVIVIKFCNLHKNTYFYIAERGIDDVDTNIITVD